MTVNTICAHRPYSAGLAGAFIDKEVETRGVGHFLDSIQQTLIVAT